MSPSVSLPQPLAWSLLRCERKSPKVSLLVVPEAVILLYQGKPVLVESGTCRYWPDAGLEPAVVRAINAYQPQLPSIRLSSPAWDFVLGAALTRAGLHLTHQPQETTTDA